MTSVKSLVATGLFQIPESYVRPEHERPTATPIYTEDIPVINLQGLHGPNRAFVLTALAKACEEWGFFEVINHGVPDEVIDSMVEAHHRFFEQPEEEKSVYKDEGIRNPGFGYGSGFTPEIGEASYWRDYLGFKLPDVIDALEICPPVLRDATREYSTHLKILAENMISALSESLGVSSSVEDVKINTDLLLNYYPPCPNPEMTVGVGVHSDPNILTILLQDDVGGLQVLHNGRWITVQPIHNAFVINVGDALEVLSNGRFQSAEHRAVPSRDRTRISIPMFCNPHSGSTIEPLAELLGDNAAPKYKRFVYGDYEAGYLTRPFTGKDDHLADVRKI